MRLAAAFLLSALALYDARVSRAAKDSARPADEDAIVEIIATCQEFDQRLPWRKSKPRLRQGLGVVIGSNQVLTAEEVVRNSTIVEIRRAQSGAKLESRVLESDVNIGAAMLAFADPEAARRFAPVAPAERVLRDDTVTVIKMDDSGQFQRDRGQVVEVFSSPRGLLFKVMTDLNVEHNGTPVFKGDRLAGIVIASERGARVCTALSADAIRNFTEDVNTPPYSGSAWAGLTWEPLLDPAKRRRLGLKETGGGILVSDTVPGSGAGAVLRAEDAIVAWDGFKLDEMGYYADPDYGRLLFTHLVNGRKKPGDKARVSIMRDGQASELEVLLARQVDAQQLIPENFAGDQPEYLAEGGIVLRELSGSYLRAAGKDWIVQNNPRLVHYYLNPRQFNNNKPGSHVVILSLVLPDQLTIGYHDFRDEVVTAVNGSPVRSLADVFAIVDRDGGLKRISMMGHGVDIVLDEKELEQANRRIASGYRIPALRHQRAVNFGPVRK